MATGQKRGCYEMEKPEASSTPLKETPVEGDMVPVGSGARNRLS